MLQHSFKAFSIKLPVPEHGRQRQTQRLHEITVDCLSSRRSNPFNDTVDVWTEIDAVWAGGIDIFPLLAGELISYEDSKGTLEDKVQEYGQRVWSGHRLPGVVMHPVSIETRTMANTDAETEISYERIIHQAFIDRADKRIDIKRFFYYQEPGNIAIHGEPAASYSPEVHEDVYNRIVAYNDGYLRELFCALDTDAEVLSEVPEMLLQTA